MFGRELVHEYANVSDGQAALSSSLPLGHAAVTPNADANGRPCRMKIVDLSTDAVPSCS